MRWLVIVGVVWLSFLGVAHCSPDSDVAPTDTSDADRIGRLIEGYRRAFGFSGVVVVSRRGIPVFARAYGIANQAFDVPNQLDTRFRIASSTKPFTALAVLRLAEAGRLELDQSVASLFPALDARVSFRHLLTHRSGLARDPVDLTDKTIASRFTLAELVGIASSEPLAFEPGTQFAYSNLGYSVLAAGIERLSGEKYGEALRQLVLAPFGMRNTMDEIGSGIVPRLASGYFLLPGGLADAAYEDKSHVAGAGSMVSTAGDLIRFIDGVAADGPLTPETRRHFLQEVEKNRSLGLVTWEYRVADDSPMTPSTGRVVMHSGSCPGFESAFGRFLDHEVSIAIVSNQSPFPAGRLFNDLANLMLGFEVAPPSSTELAAFREAINLGADRYVEKARKLSGDGSPPSEVAFNRMGYNLLSTGRIEEAITLFRVNTLLRPGSANGFDSLCEAQAANSDVAAARKSCAAALELEPGSPATQRRLRELGGADNTNAG
ncbi:MAG: serine hydrolase domain-containing protein [Lysobacteraceae bacterium]